MDEQHNYEIIIHKGDLLIELSSDDLYFISKQMDKWFRILLDDSYVPTAAFPAKPAAPPSPSLQPESPPPQRDLRQVTLPTQQPAPPVENQPSPVENFGAPSPQPPTPPQPEPSPPPVQNPVQNVMAPAEPQAIQPVQPPPPQPQPEPPPQAATQPALPPEQQPSPLPPSPQPAQEELPNKDDFEKVMDSLMEDLSGSPETGSHSEVSLPGDEPNGASSQDLEVINSLADLCRRGNLQTTEDYLMLSAYYLTYFEAQDKFSLKRLNSLMVQSGLTPVNHSVLETALSKRLLSMVPDMTGTAEMSEYALTNEGQSHVERLI